jgi:hypothetical protein
MRRLCLIFILGWLIVLAFSLVLSIAAEENNAKALFEARCSQCHSNSRPLKKIKSEEEWRQTVTRMKGKAGRRISNEEKEIIIKYLSEIRGK